MTPETSASLLERLRDPADARAWQRLVDLYLPLIHGWLRRQGVRQLGQFSLVAQAGKVVVPLRSGERSLGSG